jgi:hypothetical protein
VNACAQGPFFKQNFLISVCLLQMPSSVIAEDSVLPAFGADDSMAGIGRSDVAMIGSSGDQRSGDLMIG